MFWLQTPSIDWILDRPVPYTAPGVSVSPDCFTDFNCADIVAVLAELLDREVPALTRFADAAATLSLQINWKKMVIQSIGDFEDCPHSIGVQSETVRCVDQFTCFGSVIRGSMKSEPGIGIRTATTMNAMQQC